MRSTMRKTLEGIALGILLLVLSAALAGAEELEVGIAKDMPSVTVKTPTGETTIKRIQDTENEISGAFAKTSRACPPFCIQPMTPAEGVATIGELELIALLQDPEAIVIDSRTADWYGKGTIPGAIHLPYTVIAEQLDRLGCEVDFDGWDCTGAKRVALFCNGLWCGQSPTAIRAMIAAGFPAEKISYYRGGMQNWQLLGLTVVKP
ncbi:rhodanese-like domain-containing protein [Salaquimonas pukyongi]|uniref:rhodanese-like domain-containing protein n=1 Tax=Salaquimonas pukyongi TaxID=2712698 RepID=UPI001FCCC276|nr:rhodanese-like domain-containing protein [Salaquimonas pukyongi]